MTITYITLLNKNSPNCMFIAAKTALSWSGLWRRRSLSLAEGGSSPQIRHRGTIQTHVHPFIHMTESFMRVGTQGNPAHMRNATKPPIKYTRPSILLNPLLALSVHMVLSSVSTHKPLANQTQGQVNMQLFW